MPGRLETVIQNRPLKANKGTFPPEGLAPLRESTLELPIDELRRRYKEDGYVFVRSLLPPEVVSRAREAYFESFRPLGLLDPNHSSREAIFSGQDPTEFQSLGADLPSNDAFQKVLHESHSLPEYIEMTENVNLRSFVREFMGWQEEILLPRTLLRHNVPGAATTGTHYDKIYLRGGSADFLTAWISIGPCTIHGGGLAYLQNSSNLGFATERAFTAAAAEMTPEERISAFNANMAKFGILAQDAPAYAATTGEGRKWLVADFEAGDVVFHDPYMVHCAIRNEDELGRVRLSTDLRFVEEGSDWDRRWGEKWRVDDGV